MSNTQEGDASKGGNYQKDLYKQLMEVMARADGLGAEQKQDKKLLRRRRTDGAMTWRCPRKGWTMHYSNNMSEKDLRICKNRDKMAGSFRNASETFRKD